MRNTVPGKLLEIGCGIGSFLYLMRGAGWKVQGIEPDANYAYAGQNEYDIPIAAHLFENTDFEPGSFDLVAMFHVIEHLSSPRETLARIRHILKPGGILFLESPCIEHPYSGNLEYFFWSAHLFSFSRSTLNGLLQLVGFTPLHFGYRGDFLWVIAQRVEAESSIEVSYPLDDPKLVIRTTLQSGREFTRRQLLNARSHTLGSTAALLCRAITTLRERPEVFVPAVTRRMRSKIARLERQVPPWMPGIGKRKRIVHFGLHSPGNAGDTVLFKAVRDLFDEVNGKYTWTLESLWAKVSEETVRRINAEADAIVIGGGGVLLKDTNPNQNSGWQWNCSVENLARIEKSLIVFAIGYNRFPGQEDFDPIFRTHITEMVQRSVFFGLRNRMSIRAVAEYLPEHLRPRLRFQPCPTTLLSYIYPSAKPLHRSLQDRRLALNVAFDRHRLRYGRDEYEILAAIARAMKWANKQGWAISLAIHSRGDANIIPYLVRERVDFTEACLESVPALEVVDFYRQVPLTVGMREHSQLIPFGVQNAIISLISHPKLGYFLEDIGHPEWGIDLRKGQVEKELIDKIEQYGMDCYGEVIYEIVEAQSKLMVLTMKNLEIIRGAIL
ncbi:MAG: methyltransferase domain-containing protein [Anaerolineae bacterium]